MNKTMLIGRLTNAPEISKTTNNKSYVRVTLARKLKARQH